jgi:hypothetical protein
MQPQFIIRAVPTAHIVDVRLSHRSVQQAHHTQTRERALHGVSDENSLLASLRRARSHQEIRCAMPFQLQSPKRT